MKSDIHPDYDTAVIICGCGNRWETRSTKSELHIEVCSQCHPFFTGEQRIVDTAGRVERFRRRYGIAETDEAIAFAPTTDVASADDTSADDTSTDDAQAGDASTGDKAPSTNAPDDGTDDGAGEDPVESAEAGQPA